MGMLDVLSFTCWANVMLHVKLSIKWWSYNLKKSIQKREKGTTKMIDTVIRKKFDG